MKIGFRRGVLIATMVCCASLLDAQLKRGHEEAQVRLPGGKLQQEEILKAEHEKSLKDAAEMMDLAEQLKIELEKNDRHVLSISALKTAERIEKLAKRIRSRLRRY
jgi:hypothetical protein